MRAVSKPVLVAVGVIAFLTGMMLLLLGVPGAVELFSVAAAALILASAVTVKVVTADDEVATTESMKTTTE
jgi:membrane protein implicated in regulation of membrane protease activity